MVVHDWPFMIRASLVVALVAALLGTAVLSHAVGRPPAAGMGSPHYDAAGWLIFPADYRDWTFLSAGLDMNYSEAGATPKTHVFGNVFVPPAAYRRFKATGHWPDGTVLIVENRAGRTDGSINKSGQFQTRIVSVEAHVRDRVRFNGGWGFFAFDGRKPAERIGYAASCYSCHLANAAVDTTFVQFYPTLLPIAIARGSIGPAHRAEALSIAQ